MTEQPDSPRPDDPDLRPDAAPRPEPPVTGHHDIDRALAGLELGPDVLTHPEALGQTLDAVAQALSGQLPAGLRPRP